MFKENKKTVFVVGAGASAEINFPLGSGLKHKIAERLDIRSDGLSRIAGDPVIISALEAFLYKRFTNLNVTPYILAARLISGAMPQASSIDNFIDAHRGNEKIELCGKLAIVRSILEAEKNCDLAVDYSNIYNTINFSKVEQKWFNKFVQLLTQSCLWENLPDRLRNITFINFNYDRCIEHYLFYSFKNYYGINDEASAEVLENLKIIHPYGVVGNLPWQDPLNNIPFGQQVESGEKLLNIAAQIRTFTETIEDEILLGDLHSCMIDADTLVFLGFAYHQQNMNLIKPAIPIRAKEIYGTAYDFSSSDVRVVKDLLLSLKGENSDNTNHYNINLIDAECHELFREFWLSLSLY